MRSLALGKSHRHGHLILKDEDVMTSALELALALATRRAQGEGNLDMATMAYAYAYANAYLCYGNHGNGGSGRIMRSERISTLRIAAMAAVAGLIILSLHPSTTRLRTSTSTWTSSPASVRHGQDSSRHLHRRRRLSLLGVGVFQDPKTVELRPIINNLSKKVGIDVPPPQSGFLRDDSYIASDLVSSPSTIKPYTIENAILAANGFRDTLFFFVYDASSDTFVVVHNIPGCTFGCHRIYRVASVVSSALRKNFPERFQGEQDLVLMLSCGDAPRIKRQCMSSEKNNYCGNADFAPILQFGSVFVDTNYSPTMIAMPQPVRPHLPCFDEWQASDFGKLKGVCQDIQPPIYDVTSNQDYWDNLVPQVIWRGSDFNFLHSLFPDMRSPIELDIAPNEQGLDDSQFANEYDKKRWAIETLWGMWEEKLLPRWRGVLMTSEAEIEVSIEEEQRGTVSNKQIPWINIKFTHFSSKGEKIPVGKKEEYQKLQSLGISCIGDYVSMSDQANYKYHIDLGGGGGTTWTGTIQKLALPGVLFHHVTPTKDWFHDMLVPWVHYIPINTDLSDLREKYEWAESHPDEARRISENGTSFVRWMASVEGFGRLYEAYLATPLRNAMLAYQNSVPSEYEGKRVLDIIIEKGNGEFTIVSTCSGLRMNSCTK